MAQESIVRILIASDVHAGFGENKPFIMNDSFNTLDEVLTKAEEKKVDFILMAGDLFHENHPTRETQLKVVRSLRKHCLKEGKPNLNFHSDPTINFQHSDFGCANYLDPNLHVSMPIFTIHGNHDDLSGKGLSALDVLHETGLINLFGKFRDVDQIEVSPILLSRGNTKIAIYGIGSQRDDRLARAFSKGRVTFIRPDDDPDSWFSILVLHQNRPPRSKLRSTKSHLSFKCIPAWVDLVIWGHEHECRIEPEKKHLDPMDDSKSFFVIQPGSTVATSLSTEEAGQKHIGVLQIREKQFKLTKIELETTRQIIIDELVLDEMQPAVKLARSSVRQKNMPDEPLIIARVEKLLKEAEAKRKPRQPQPPRVRLKVVYSGKWLNIPPVNARKFGVNFANKVANPTEMIYVRVIRDEKKATNVNEHLSNILRARADDVCSIDEMVNKYFSKCEFKTRLNVLSEIAMGKQLQEYSNTEVNTQFKYTAADKAMNENIKEQVNKISERIKGMIEAKMEQNFNTENEVPIDQQIANCIFLAKRERLMKTEAKGVDDSTLNNETALNTTAETTFHERAYNPDQMMTSTPRASQEREIRWTESVRPIASRQEAARNDDDDDEVMDITEQDFSP